MIETKKFYTCKYDKAFKEIMMKKENFNILKSVLEVILDMKIKKIEIQPLNLLNNNIYLKGKEVDLLVTTDIGKIEVEVNTYYEDYVKPRNFCYISNIYINQITVGETYSEEIEVIQINLNYNSKDEELKRVYKVMDESKKEYIKNFRIYEINMDILKEIWYDKKESEINKYKYLIMLDMDMKTLKNLPKDKVVEEYMEKIEKLNQDPMFINWITKEEDERKIKNTQISLAYNNGLNDGISEGISQGIDTGKKELIKTMLQNGASTEQISKLTGLSIDEINNI
mgnify:CR=1 FL=1